MPLTCWQFEFFLGGRIVLGSTRNYRYCSEQIRTLKCVWPFRSLPLPTIEPFQWPSNWKLYSPLFFSFSKPFSWRCCVLLFVYMFVVLHFICMVFFLLNLILMSLSFSCRPLFFGYPLNNFRQTTTKMFTQRSLIISSSLLNVQHIVSFRIVTS